MANYIDAEILKANAEATESDDDSVYDGLVTAVSRLFDRECEVADDFFAPAAEDATERSFRTDGTNYLKLAPFVAGSISAIDVDGTAVTLADDDEYIESENYLVFNADYYNRTPVTVTARWGFAAVPADISQACIEQALFMWRRKDLAFTDLAGVASSAVAAEFSPTFLAVTRRYRGLYSSNNYFS